MVLWPKVQSVQSVLWPKVIDAEGTHGALAHSALFPLTDAVCYTAEVVVLFLSSMPAL